MIGRMVKALGDSAVVSVHCHDDLGLAAANSLAALQAGARQIECTINGIGERAGNAALEEVVMAMNTRRDRLPFETRIVTEQLYPGEPDADFDDHLRAAAEQGDRRRERVRARSRHSSGRIFERAHHLRDHGAEVGGRAGDAAGAGQAQRPARAGEALRRSGNSAATREQLDVVYQRFTALADRKKGLRNDEIAALAREVLEETKAASAAAD